MSMEHTRRGQEYLNSSPRPPSSPPHSPSPSPSNNSNLSGHLTHLSHTHNPQQPAKVLTCGSAKTNSQSPVAGRHIVNGHVTPSRQSTTNTISPTPFHISAHSHSEVDSSSENEEMAPKSYSNAAQADPLRRTRASSQAIANPPPPPPFTSALQPPPPPPSSSRSPRKRKISETSIAQPSQESTTSQSTSSQQSVAGEATQTRSSKRIKKEAVLEEENASHEIELETPVDSTKRTRRSTVTNATLPSGLGRSGGRKASSASAGSVVRSSSMGQARASSRVKATKTHTRSSQASDLSPRQTRSHKADNVADEDVEEGTGVESPSVTVDNGQEPSEVTHQREDGEGTNGLTDLPTEHGLEDDTAVAAETMIRSSMEGLLGDGEIDADSADDAEGETDEEIMDDGSLVAEPQEDSEVAVVLEDQPDDDDDDDQSDHMEGTLSPALEEQDLINELLLDISQKVDGDNLSQDKADAVPQVTEIPKRGRWPGKVKTGPKASKEATHPTLQRMNSGPSSLLGLKKIRGGPGKRKISKYWKLNAYYDRQMALKTQYKSVARLIAACNDILAGKALDKINDEPEHYKLEPAYAQVTQDLKRRAEDKQAEIKDRLALKTEALHDWFQTKQDYENQKFEDAKALAYENSIYRARIAILGVVSGRSVGNEDEAASEAGDDFMNLRDFTATKSDVKPKPAKPIARVVTTAKRGRGGRRGRGRWTARKSPEEARDISDQTPEELPTVQAPIARKASMMSIPKILDVSDEDEAGQSEKDEEMAQQRSAKSIMGASKPAEDDTRHLNTASALRSVTSTPAVSVVDGDALKIPVILPGQALVGSQDLKADRIHVEPHEVLVTNRKRGRGGVPNNRLVVAPWFKFEEGEIGIRPLNYKEKWTQEEAGELNPPTIHFDHTSANGDRIVDYQPEDFDPVMVKYYGVHPQFGIPITGCRNPDIHSIGNGPEDAEFRKKLMPTDFSKPLARTYPNSALFHKEDGAAYRASLSRVEPRIRAEKDFDGLDDKLSMIKALLAAGHLDTKTTGFATYDAAARDRLNADIAVEELIDAVNHLEKHPDAGDEMDKQLQERQALEIRGVEHTKTPLKQAPSVAETPNAVTSEQNASFDSSPIKAVSPITTVSPPKRKRMAAKINTDSPVRRSGRDRRPTTKLAPPPAPPTPAPAPPPLPQIEGPPDTGSALLSCLADAVDIHVDLHHRHQQARLHSDMIRHGHAHALENEQHRSFIPYQIPQSHPQNPLHPLHQVLQPMPLEPHISQQRHQPGPYSQAPPAMISHYGMNPLVPPGLQGQHMHHIPPMQPVQHNSPYLNPPPPRRQSQVQQMTSPEQGPSYYNGPPHPPFFQGPPQPQPHPSSLQPNQRSGSRAPREIRPRTDSFYAQNAAPMPQFMGPPPQHYHQQGPPPPPQHQGYPPMSQGYPGPPPHVQHPQQGYPLPPHSQQPGQPPHHQQQPPPSPYYQAGQHPHLPPPPPPPPGGRY